jgi:hypothetical protein
MNNGGRTEEIGVSLVKEKFLIKSGNLVVK